MILLHMTKLLGQAMCTRLDQGYPFLMTTTVNVYEAKTRLSALLALVEGGEEVIIARNGRPIAMLGPLHSRQFNRSPGQLRGKIDISQDFDEFTDDDAAAWYSNPVR